MKFTPIGHRELSTIYVCPKCGLSYKDAEMAKNCAKWCGGTAQL